MSEKRQLMRRRMGEPPQTLLLYLPAVEVLARVELRPVNLAFAMITAAPAEMPRMWRRPPSLSAMQRLGEAREVAAGQAGLIADLASFLSYHLEGGVRHLWRGQHEAPLDLGLLLPADLGTDLVGQLCARDEDCGGSAGAHLWLYRGSMETDRYICVWHVNLTSGAIVPANPFLLG